MIQFLDALAIFFMISMASNPIRDDYHQGGREDVVEHVLNILSGDPTKN